MASFVLFDDDLTEGALCPTERNTGWLTRRDTVSVVVRLAHSLQSEHGQALRRVVVACDDRYALLVACLAVWRLGGVAVLPPNLLPKTVNGVALESAASLVLTDISAPAFLPKYVRLAPDMLEPSASFEANDGALAIDETKKVLAIYTSGTTGTQQCVDKSASQVLGEALTLIDTFGFGAESLVAATVPAHHLYGLLFSALVPLLSGGRFLRPSLFQPFDVAAAVHRFGVTDLVTVPTHIKALGKASLPRLPTLGRVFSSGAVLDRELGSALSTLLGCRVVDVLGSTESGGIGFRDASEMRYTPLPGVEVSADEDGRLRLRSRFASPESAMGEWLTLGDRIEVVDDGFVHLGRDDGVVKVGGKRVALQELEARAREIVGVLDAAALFIESEARGHEIWLFVVTRGDNLQPAAIREVLSASFDRVVLPRRTLLLDELPRTPLGKVDRGALLRRFDQ